MQDKEEVLGQPDDDSLAEPFHAVDRPAFRAVERRGDRAEHERSQQPDALDPLSDDPLGQARDVDIDVRQFRHTRSV